MKQVSWGRRLSSLLLLAGILFASALGGCSRQSGDDDSGAPRQPSLDAMALVNQAELREEDLRQLIPAEFRESVTGAEIRGLLDRWIETELLYQRAMKEGLERDPQVAETLLQTRRQILADEYLQRELKNRVRVSNQDIQAYYDSNIDMYTQEMTRLDGSIAAIRAGKLSEMLLREDVVEEMGWFWKLEQLPDAPESVTLAQLIAGHDFQEALKNYRDLRFALARLEQWSADIGIYQDMLTTRRAAFAGRLPAVLGSRRTQDYARLAAARDRYAGELTRIADESDSAALATDKEQELLARLERIRQRLARQVDAGGETQERYRLVHGLLTWNMAADFRSRLWSAQKSLKELDRLLLETQSRRAALEQAQEEEPRRFDVFASRIRALAPRISFLQGQARELARAQEAHLGELAIAELRKQRERLAEYLTQARFAVAQIYDQSSAAEQVTP